MVRNVRCTADNATTLPFPVRSHGGGRRGAQTIDVATAGVPANGGDNGSTRPTSTSAAERGAAAERRRGSDRRPRELREDSGSTSGRRRVIRGGGGGLWECLGHIV